MAKFNPNGKATRFMVRVSSAHMPNSCWGRYENIAVLEVTSPIGTDHHIRETSECRIVHFWGKCNVGKTDRCAASKAYTAAVAMRSTLESEALWAAVHA